MLYGRIAWFSLSVGTCVCRLGIAPKAPSAQICRTIIREVTTPFGTRAAACSAAVMSCPFPGQFGGVIRYPSTCRSLEGTPAHHHVYPRTNAITKTYTSGLSSTSQDVAHIWELGGGSHVSDLVRVPITPDRFHDALYVIVVDLSRPSSVIPHLLQWTDQIKVFVALVR